ncbi:hypothetical protein, partial [Thermomonas sp.]|uniref:hypothetical protein n=1 Tax=Thermomonas sp. TaxID=1971895 RepID=UPI002C2C3163
MAVKQTNGPRERAVCLGSRLEEHAWSAGAVRQREFPQRYLKRNLTTRTEKFDNAHRSIEQWRRERVSRGFAFRWILLARPMQVFCRSSRRHNNQEWVTQMNDNRNVTRSAKAARTIKQSAMTRAVRSVLAASALTLALGATSGTAAAAAHKVPVAHALQLQRAAIDFAAVQDLSLVPQGQGLVATVTPTAIPPIIQPGDIVLNNSTAQNDSGAWPINILVVSTGVSGSQPGDVTITNSGDLTANATSGNAFNIYANAYADLSITNSADLVTTNTGGGSAIGIVGKAYNGSIMIDNDGDISATAVNWAYGMYLLSGAGGTTVTNDGDITATSSGFVAMGIKSLSNGDTVITNTGAINVDGVAAAVGM